MNKKIIVGVDLGGTKMVAGVINTKGEVIGSPVKVATKSEEPAESIVKRMIDSIYLAISNAGSTVENVLGIGIGSPSPLDIKKGIILTTQNLPTLHYYRLKEKISATFKVPVYINNDANCFALGEAYFGTVQIVQNAVGITLGTGFGCGLIINRRVYCGSTDTAAEIDLCPYLDGNLEDYISGRGVVRIYKKISGKESTPPQIHDLAARNDSDAQKAWEEFGYHLGLALAYIVNILDPEVSLIGGSLSNAYAFFSRKMTNTLHKNINPVPRKKLKIERSTLGENAGFIGAACLVLMEHNH
jgi:glucokinase